MEPTVVSAIITAVGLTVLEVVRRRTASVDSKQDALTKYITSLQADNKDLRDDRARLEAENEEKDTLIARLKADLAQTLDMVQFWKQRNTAIELDRDNLRRELDRRLRGE